MYLEADNTAVVPNVEQEVVDDNSAATVDSANSGIEHTSTPYTVGPGTDTKKTENIIALNEASLTEPLLDEED